MERSLVLCAAVLVAACTSIAPSTTPELLRVYASSATYPWLEAAYTCASPTAAIEITSPDSAQLRLRFGEPTILESSAFQIGTDDLLVVVQPQAAVSSLTLDQVRQVFSGQVQQWKDVGGADLEIQVWTYSEGEDVQVLFDRLVMRGEPVASLARLAASAQAMSDSVGATPGAIGFLPRRWKAGNTEAVFTLPSIPILALASSPPQGALRNLIACMQSK